jgi:phosphoglycerate dehydrogenase-like enzyme
MRTGGFQWHLGTEMFEKTLGIIGTGRIGKRVAEIGRAFGMKLLGYDVREDKSFAASVGLRYVSLRQLLAESDVVTIHTPRLPETMGLVNAEKIGWMKPTAFLINTARGGIVDETALVAALREGKLAGAALDVFAQEPLPANDPLRQLPNVVLTPHVAAAATETSRRIYLQALGNIVAVLDGKRPPNPVNEVKL